MDIIQLGETGQDIVESFVHGVLGELDLTHVETSNTTNGITRMDYSGGLSLGLGKDDVDHVLSRRNGLDTLKNILHFYYLYLLLL